MKKILKKLCIAYIVVVFLLLLAAIVIPGRNGEGRIYYYDALLLGIKVEGTVWDTGIEFFLNYPMSLAFTPFFMFFSIRAFIFTIVAWSPILYLLILKFRKRHIQPVGGANGLPLAR